MEETSLLGSIKDMVFWHWWVLALVLLVLEATIPGAVFLWMAVAAGIVGALLLLMADLSWQSQWTLFAITSVVSMVAWRHYQRHHPTKTDRPLLNRRTQRYLGRTLTLDTAIVNGVGSVNMDSTLWSVKGEDQPAGTTVKIIGAEGSVLLVEAVPPIQ
ncbi:MAG: NfeD family protein [Gammaproteobacteria bacterium]|nr:NfeD family protein [Gammaproteobacteria bacterium]